MERSNYENKPIQILPPKKKKISDKNSDIFLISAQKHRVWVLVRTASARRGGSNEYPQSMFLSRNKKVMYTLVNPNFTWFKGFNII